MPKLRIRALPVALLLLLPLGSGAFSRLSAQASGLEAARSAGVRTASAADLGALLVRRSNRVRITVLYATRCSNSQAMFDDLGPLSHSYGPRGVEFFAYSVDDTAEEVASIPAFMREHRARVQSRWLEPGVPGELSSAVGRIGVPLGSSFTLPLVIIQDKTGMLVWSGEGLRSLDGLDGWLDGVLR